MKNHEINVYLSLKDIGKKNKVYFKWKQEILLTLSIKLLLINEVKFKLLKMHFR